MLGTILAWALGLLMMFGAAINAGNPGYGEPKGFTAGHLAWVVLAMGIIAASYLSRIAMAAEALARASRGHAQEPPPVSDTSRTAKAGAAAGRYIAAKLGLPK